MKKHGFEIDDYNLPASIRKRIDDLVGLNINPSTINLITAEFSAISEEVKENIGRYIARLLEIEDYLIEQENERTKEFNTVGLNLKKEMIMKNRQNNLLRIQQIFLKTDEEKKQAEIVNIRAKEVDSSPEKLLNYKDAMVINNTVEAKESDYLKHLANKKRKIELAILEQQEKIKVAQKQYKKAVEEDDNLTQELKINVVKLANERLQEISDAIKKYKTVDKIPDEIIEDQRYNKKDSNSRTNYERTFDQENNQKTLHKEHELDTFFDVPGYEENDNFSYEKIFCRTEEEMVPNRKSKKTINKKASNKKTILTDKKVKKTEKQEKKEQEKQIKKEQKMKKTQETLKENDKKVKKEKKEVKTSTVLEEKKNKENQKEIEKTQSLSKSVKKNFNINESLCKIEDPLNDEQNFKFTNKDEFEKIIKKFKKKIRTKDKQLEKLIKEKEKLYQEVVKLKEEKKINELRKAEEKKIKLKNEFDQNIKKEKRKIETTHNILEKKWKAETVAQSLNSKSKAFKAVELIKEKSKINSSKSTSQKNTKKIEPNTNNVIKVQETQNIIENKDLSIDRDRVQFSYQLKKQLEFEDNEKQIAYLERKRKFNTISKEDLIKLNNLKEKNKHTSNNLNFKKLKNQVKNNFSF